MRVRMMYRQDKTRLCAVTLMWMSVDVVIGVRVMQYHAIIDVVIGVRVMLCHQAMDDSGFSTFLNFPLRVQILILLSVRINSSSLFPVAILCTLLHRENTSFEVWYLHTMVLCLRDDQLEGAELACTDLLTRRTQMIEFKCKDRVLSKPTMDMDPFNDRHLYLGTSETRGSPMECPALEKYVKEQVQLKSLATKQRRKAAEQRSGRGEEMTSSLLDASGGLGIKRNMLPDVGDGSLGQQGRAAPQCLLPSSPPDPDVVTGLQPGACRTVRRPQERLAHWRAWHDSGIRTINELCRWRATPRRRDSSRAHNLLLQNFGTCLRGCEPTSKRPHRLGIPW